MNEQRFKWLSTFTIALQILKYLTMFGLGIMLISIVPKIPIKDTLMSKILFAVIGLVILYFLIVQSFLMMRKLFKALRRKMSKEPALIINDEGLTFWQCNGHQNFIPWCDIKKFDNESITDGYWFAGHRIDIFINNPEEYIASIPNWLDRTSAKMNKSSNDTPAFIDTRYLQGYDHSELWDTLHKYWELNTSK